MASAGMNKSGTQDILEARTKITGWVVRPGFPGTQIVNDELVISGTGAGVVYALIEYVSGGTTQERFLMHNGVQVASASGQSALITLPMSLADGDRLWLEGHVSSDFSDRDRVATSSYLYYDQTTQDFPVSSDPVTNWYVHPSMGVGAQSAVDDVAIGWDVNAGIGKQADLDASRSTTWSVDAGMYVGVKRTAGADAAIGWGVQADMLHLRKPQTPQVLWEESSISIHTADGRVLGALLCRGIDGLSWSRERREVSTCEITALTQADPELMEDIRPWVHWVTVWHGDVPVWSGPIQSATLGRTVTRIVAKDPATFMWRTRVPVTRTWSNVDPTAIAADMLQSMNELHQLQATPVVLPAAIERFTYSATADSRMLHQMFDDLAKLGLEWTVVAGRFVLGRFPERPVASLAECDFLVEIERLRDGSATFNDVRVQGQNWAHSVQAPLAGLRLQTLVSLDDVFGVSNIEKAAQLYAQETATLRDTLIVPASASLHPEAEVGLDDLIPGKYLSVQAAGISALMVVDQMRVTVSPSSSNTEVSLVAVSTPNELADAAGG